MSKNLCFIVFMFFALMAAPVFAQDSLEQGIQAGVTIPVPIALPDQSGIPKSLNDITGDKGLILMFNRSSDWCGYCVLQMKQWNMNVQRFKDIGYNIAAVTYDDVTQQRVFAKKNGITYPVLSDDGSYLIMSFGLLNENYKPDSSYYGIPHPVIYVIRSDGLITHRFSNTGHQERPDIDMIYRVLNQQT